MIPKDADYQTALEAVNASITENDYSMDMGDIMTVEHLEKLTPIQKKYLIQKIHTASFAFKCSMERGNFFIGKLPARLRTYETFLFTVRYIKHLPAGKQQFRLMQRVCAILNHDKRQPVTHISRRSVAEEIYIILKNSYISSSTG